VTIAEYAQFVRATKHPAPTDWPNGEPPPGYGRYPVVNVSYEDAQVFALWRSQRDGVRYRLPTEEEWEYAAKGTNDYRYPWGNDWRSGCANVGGTAPVPVGSYAHCESVWSVQDMLGNVWEWTSSHASFYPGNTEYEFEEAGRVKFVVRGGSFADSPDGKKPLRLTVRQWGEASGRDPTVGFRLVRPG
jgi:formylglycine-generating enzyme required for sulfatase activity